MAGIEEEIARYLLSREEVTGITFQGNKIIVYLTKDTKLPNKIYGYTVVKKIVGGFRHATKKDNRGATEKQKHNRNS